MNACFSTRLPAFSSLFLFLIMLFGGGVVLSAEINPKTVAEEAARSLTARLVKEKQQIKDNPEEVKKLVEQELLPIFDAQLMARLVMSASWKKANVDQQQEFVLAFRKILINTYANAFAAYDGQALEFKDAIFNKNQTKAIVKSKILQEGKMPILVDYRLRKKEGKWLVYDAEIEGVGLVKSYRSQIQEKIDEKGIAAMIDDMKLEACGANGCEPA